MQTEETKSWVERLSPDEAKDCLASLLSLASHVDGAMDAIVQRKLPLLQENVRLQEASCDRLTDLRRRSKRVPSVGSETENTPIDSDLAAEIEAATASLLLLNQRYSALLKHSGETLRLLAGLYRSYCSFAQSRSGAQANLQANLRTWSCEV